MQYYMLTVAFPAFTKWGPLRKKTKICEEERSFGIGFACETARKRGTP